MRLKIIHLVTLFLILTHGSAAQHNPNPSPEITAGEVRHHVRYLASQELQGRKAGTEAANKAAAYIAEEFRRYGLQPFGEGGSFFQDFEFVSDVQLGEKNILRARIGSDRIQYSVKSDFVPLAFSKDTSVTGTVVFAGYGISAKDLEYDDYANVDVSGKVVLVLQYGPEGENPHGKFSKYLPLRLKAMNAREKGASALLLVKGPLDDEEDKLMGLRYDFAFSDAGIPCLHVRQRVAEKILKTAGVSLKEIQEKLNTTQKPASFPISGASVVLTSHVEKIRSRTKNVIGLLPGTDPRLKEQYLVVGAHYDHLGLGGAGSLTPDTVAVHHGADDNASGTGGLLELAQMFASRQDDLKRSVLFIGFAAEESGNLGSGHFVNDPRVPLKDIIGMLNFDMIGREKDSVLIVHGTGTSPSWNPLLEQFNNPKRFNLKLNPEGFGPSDHSSFYAKDIPVLFFFTGVHEDYHKPSDTEEKINAEGQAEILQFAWNIAREIVNQPERPLFTKVDEPRQRGESVGFRVYFGTVPDYAEQVEGLKISAVRKGSPAEKAGLLGGDIIVKFGGKSIKNIYDYTYALQDFKPGDEVEVVVTRGEEILHLRATLEKRGD